MASTAVETAVQRDELDALVREVLDKTVQNVAYSHAKAGQWNTEAAEAILKRLAGLGKPYKFIVGCTVLPKTTTTGLHTAHAFYWDSAHDVSAPVRWENKHVYCIANVFAVRL